MFASKVARACLLTCHVSLFFRFPGGHLQRDGLQRAEEPERGQHEAEAAQGAQDQPALRLRQRGGGQQCRLRHPRHVRQIIQHGRSTQHKL